MRSRFDRESFFLRRFAQSIIERDERLGVRLLFAPDERGRKVKRVGGALIQARSALAKNL